MSSPSDSDEEPEYEHTVVDVLIGGTEARDRLVVEFKGDLVELEEKLKTRCDEIEKKSDEEAKCRVDAFEKELNEANGEDAKNEVKKKYDKLQLEAEIVKINDVFQLHDDHMGDINEFVRNGVEAFSDHPLQKGQFGYLVIDKRLLFEDLMVKSIEQLRERMTDENKSFVEQMIGDMQNTKH